MTQSEQYSTQRVAYFLHLLELICSKNKDIKFCIYTIMHFHLGSRCVVSKHNTPTAEAIALALFNSFDLVLSKNPINEMSKK